MEITKQRSVCGHLAKRDCYPSNTARRWIEQRIDRIDRIRFGSSRGFVVLSHARFSPAAAPFDCAQGRLSGADPYWVPPSNQPVSKGPEIQRTQRPEAPEIRDSKAGGHHPKTAVVEPEDRKVPATEGAAHEPSVIPERPAAQHAQHSIRRIPVFPAILRIIWIAKLRFTEILAPQATRPLPHVPGHIQRAARASAGGILPNRRRVTDVTTKIAQFLRRRVIAPWIDPAIVSRVRLSPTRLRWGAESPCPTPGLTTGRTQRHPSRRH